MLICSRKINPLLCLLLLVISGNPIFIYSPYVRELYILIGLFSLLLVNYTKSDGLQIFVKYGYLFVLIGLIQQVYISDLSFNSQLFSILRLMIGVLLVREIGDSFVSEYIKVMTFIALISLVGFFINATFGFIPGGVQVTKIGYSLGLFTQLYSKFSGLVLRNCGMFWEPGAFQGYLNIAIAFALLSPKTRERKCFIFILVFALITTFSTTGYIAFGLILIFYIFSFSDFSRINRLLITIVVFLCCVYAFFALDFIGDKISDNLANAESAQGRVTDFIRYGDILKNNFFLGVNTFTGDDTFYTGNGFVFMLLYYGGILVLYYFSTLFFSLQKNNSSKFAVYFSFVVIMTLQGEGFMFYPLYLALPCIIYRFDRPLTFRLKDESK